VLVAQLIVRPDDLFLMKRSEFDYRRSIAKQVEYLHNKQVVTRFPAEKIEFEKANDLKSRQFLGF
jgi:hypothetical protein